MSAKKMGRPISDNPKSNRINVRLDNETLAALTEHCNKIGVNKADAIRQGIFMLLGKSPK